MSRRYAASDVSESRYDDRLEYDRRTNGRRGYDDRSYEEDRETEYRSSVPRRERDTLVREEVRIRERDTERPAHDFLRDDYARQPAGQMVLRAREVESYDYAPRPAPRRRSPSPEPIPERVKETEEIIIRREENERPSPPPLAPVPPRDYRGPPGRDREEIIIRRKDTEREPERRGPSESAHERDEIIIRRDQNGGRRYDDEIDIREDAHRSRRGPPPEREREEIIVRRSEREDSRESRLRVRGGPGGPYDDYALTRPKSHERERSRPGRGSESDEIIIRRDEREGGRGGDREREEIIIRHHEHSRSPSPASSIRPPLEPPIIRAPPIHQEIITHHRHIDHGYEMALAPIIAPPRSRPVSRAPSPPAPLPPQPREEERIEIRRHGERNGRAYDEDIIIDRNEGPPPAPRSVAPIPRPPPSVRAEDPYDRGYESPARRGPYRDPYRDDRDIQDEAEYYNARAIERGYPGEAYNGATRDWGLVDIPPGTSRVRMDGVGGGSQELTWQRYNGSRRAKFMPESASDEGYGSGELAMGRPAPAAGGNIGARYGRERDGREGLWTEITKDLVVKEAFVEAGYEFEETEEFYYVFKNLKYEDVARLVGLSEDIKNDRRKRIQQLEWESRVIPPAEEVRRPLAIEGPGLGPGRGGGGLWDVEDERYIEREVVYRGGRPPPPGLGPGPGPGPRRW